MRHVITLEEYDYSRLSFRCRHVCDRDYHKQTDDIRALMIDQKFANRFARMDMFWVEVTCDDVDLGPLCIEPRLYANKFQVSQNHCEVSDDRLFKLASEWFMLQPEYQQQLANLRDIETFINSHGGQVEWTEQCKQAVIEHAELKQTTIAQYADRFALAIDDKAERTKLDNELRLVTGLYVKLPWMFSGIDHLIYLYKQAN